MKLGKFSSFPHVLLKKYRVQYIREIREHVVENGSHLVFGAVSGFGVVKALLGQIVISGTELFDRQLAEILCNKIKSGYN